MHGNTIYFCQHSLILFTNLCKVTFMLSEDGGIGKKLIICLVFQTLLYLSTTLFLFFFAQKKGVVFVKIFDFQISKDLLVLECPTTDFTIFADVCLSASFSLSKILWQLFFENQCAKYYKTLYLVAPRHKFVPTNFM